MSYSVSFLLNGGLFDFDLTFAGEGILFLLFSLVVTFAFLSPISKQLDDRAEFIDFNLRKSTFLVIFGYKKFSNSVQILNQEISEFNRQIKLSKTYTISNFENEVNLIQKENAKLLSNLKGELSIKSAYLFSRIANDLNNLTENFFTKKFHSN